MEDALIQRVSDTGLQNIIVDSKPSGEGFAIVLLKVVNNGVEFTTHTHNLKRDSIDHGHYYQNIVDAAKDFEKRE